MGWRVLDFGQNCSEICSYAYTVSGKYVAQGLQFLAICFMRLFTGVPCRGSVEHQNFIHRSHVCCSLTSVKNNIEIISKSLLLFKVSTMFDVGSRQKITTMDSKRAIIKCIATVLICQPY